MCCHFTQLTYKVGAQMIHNADVRYLQERNISQVETRYDEEFGIYWAFMNPIPRPCFNSQLLTELRSYIDHIVGGQGTILHKGHNHPVKYGVLASKVPGVFNLGGDLALFKRLIEARDREALIRYGESCIDNLYPWHRNCELPMTTISLVQGDALGGGFEAALSASVLVAEESARMGFPEILFNLFPGMGAFSFLSRKVGRRTAEELITSGAVYTARQLFDLGVVDVITAEGTGEAAVYSYVRKHAKSGNGRRAFERARSEVLPIERNELSRVVAVWADAALQIQERDLRMMERLVRAQQRSAQVDPQDESDNIVKLQVR
jgi:DSF synthase